MKSSYRESSAPPSNPNRAVYPVLDFLLAFRLAFRVSFPLRRKKRSETKLSFRLSFVSPDSHRGESFVSISLRLPRQCDPDIGEIPGLGGSTRRNTRFRRQCKDDRFVSFFVSRGSWKAALFRFV